MSKEKTNKRVGLDAGTLRRLCKITGILSLIVITGFFLFSCREGTTDNIPDVMEDIVVLVYLGGDNSLSEEVYAKTEALCKGYGRHVDEFHRHLLIYSDPADRLPCLLEAYIDQVGKPALKQVRGYAEENSADSRVFSSVINDMRILYPAASYGLVVFSHASGWLPENTLNNLKQASPLKSVLDDQGREMALSDFAEALPDKLFDYIIFEACFMSGIEVAYQLRNKAEYILASSAEIVSPGFTPVYPEAVACLFEKEGAARQFARKAFDWFDSQSGYMRSSTLSVIRTSALEELAAFVRNNCGPGAGANLRGDIAADITGIQHFDRYTSYHLFFDLEDYYGRLLPTDESRKELARMVNACVYWKASTEDFMVGVWGFDIISHSGLTVYIPQGQFPYLNAEYKKLEWAKAIGFV